VARGKDEVGVGREQHQVVADAKLRDHGVDRPDLQAGATATIPQLRSVSGAPKDGAIFLHRKVVEQTRALWAAWEKAVLLRLVLSWAGAWNPRLVRGGTTLSRHAYAVGWDINAAWNPLGKAPAPAGSTGSVVELVPLAVEHGYTNGMNWSRPDPMHFEVCRVM
jgi:hypothetical protein